ncbi:DoxX family membrane protein [Agreia sp.]|uniref:DoxX family protein n=1 Tax=Agreia sp. TaxID=1872416 RepID=UPI0035BC6301
MTDATLTVIVTIVRILIAVVFIGMGINHFVPKSARVMAKMIPPALRREGALRPLNLVYFTGVCEIAGGIGLLVPQTRLAAAIALVVFLAAVFPANAYAAADRERFGTLAIPFWPRLGGQVVLAALIVWVAVA